MSVLKYIYAVESNEKKKRKTALEGIRVDLFADDCEDFEKKVAVCYKQVLRCFCDSSENCRELAVCIITDILNKIEDSNDKYFPLIIPILVQRLGNAEILESSEEVRLLLTELCHLIIRKFSKCLTQYVEEMIQILLRTLNDPHPKIKKESCACVADFSKVLPRQLYSYTSVLAKPILEDMKHQHSRVRVSAIDAIGELYVRGDSKSLETVLVPVAERLFDQAPTVRCAVIRITASWMLHMPDRYSFYARLIPLLLTGLHDTVPEIRELSQKLWISIGDQYVKENEEDMKDKINFPVEVNNYYYTIVGGERPSLGCRALASRHMHWLVGALTNELRDWRADLRLRAAQLLLSMAQLSEARATHYLPALADALAGACADEDVRVAEAACAAARALGAWIPASSWVKLLLPALSDLPPTSGRLLLLASLVRGSPPEELAPLLHRLARRLCASDVRAAAASPARAAALQCMDALLFKALEAREDDALLGDQEGDEDADVTLLLEQIDEEATEDVDEIECQGEESEEKVVKKEAATEDEDEEKSESEEANEDGLGETKEERTDNRPVLEILEPYLFRALLTLKALEEEGSPQERLASDLLFRLAAARHGVAALWVRRLPPLLRSLAAACPRWSSVAADRRVLEAALRAGAEGGEATLAVAAALGAVCVAVAACTAPGQPPEGATSALTLLARTLSAGSEGAGDGASASKRVLNERLPRCAPALVRDALTPALVWKAGRSAEAVRCAASACLLSLLRALPLPIVEEQESSEVQREVQNELNDALAPLVPLLTSLSEDSCRSTRHSALRSLPWLLRHAADVFTDYEGAQQVAKMLQAALRRLDDADDGVRVAALNSVEALACTLASSGRRKNDTKPKYAVHLESAYDVLLLHLDDPDESFRRTVLRTLTKLGPLYPSALQEKLMVEREKFRHPAEALALYRCLESLVN